VCADSDDASTARERRIAEARKALADLTLDERLNAAAALSYWIQVELAGWELAQQNGRIH
jgi:hypothetical protein